MLTKDQLREVVFNKGADLFGIASIDRFDNPPEGFHPKDIYPVTKSVLAFAIKVPAETLFADNPIPLHR